MSLLAPSSSHLRSSRGEHEPLPSLPPSPSPSPTEEEDLANGSSAWKGVRDEDRLMVKTDTKGKGKGKAREVVDLNQDDDGADSYGTLTPVRESSEGMSAYPPTTEEEEEAKRIEENLRRWEQAERQKRKAAREKAAGATAPSVVGEVSRRASLLWTGKRSSRTSSRVSGSFGGAGSGAHSVLHARNSEDAVAMSDLETRSVQSPGSSNPTSPIPPTFTMITENPFEPPDSASPLRGFEGSSGSGSAVMNPSSSPPPPTPAALDMGESPFDDSKSVPTPTALKRPTLLADHASTSAPPPPQPLNLPPPKTPPPRMLSPGITSPPGPTPNPSVTGSGIADANEPQWKKRWWTDWLCGCREGPDRGGDDQAGRTNPFE